MLEFNTPRGVVVNADGDIVVADTGNQRVARYYAKKGVYLPAVRRGEKERLMDPPS